MSELLSPDKLLSLLFEDIDKTNPCIIYMGVGTHCNVPLWNYELNQQMPIFLHDWKINNSDIPIKIILFDGFTKDDPYIVNDTNAYYSESFFKDPKYSNVYKSEFGIQVYNFPLNVKWINDKYNMAGEYDITELVANIVKRVSDSNHIFFFHEFTGRNPENLEYVIKQMTNYDENKVCIDISRGRDLSCCVNFSEPENYPLISQRGKLISWLNPKLIPFEKRKLLIDKFIKKDITITECPYNNLDMFDFYLYKQIMNMNQYIYNTCSKMIYLLRLLYNKDAEFTKMEENYILNLDVLTLKIDKFSVIYNGITAQMLQLKEIIETTDDKNIIYAYKIALLEKLNGFFEICLGNIKIISKEQFDELFIEFDALENKNKLINIFRNFCLRYEIVF